jgi:hypothetical protein
MLEVPNRNGMGLLYYIESVELHLHVAARWYADRGS